MNNYKNNTMYIVTNKSKGMPVKITLINNNGSSIQSTIKQNDVKNLQDSIEPNLPTKTLHIMCLFENIPHDWLYSYMKHIMNTDLMVSENKTVILS